MNDNTENQYPRSNEPIFWSLFGYGGMVIAFALPAIALCLIYAGFNDGFTGFHILEIMSHWWGALALFLILFGVFFHSVHRIYFSLHDIKCHTGIVGQILLYGLAAILTLSAAVLLILNFIPAAEYTDSPPPAAAQVDKCPDIVQPQGLLYEEWSLKSGLLHVYDAGLDIEVGDPNAQKYLERNAVSPWLTPEFISPEAASADKMDWAANRYVRWLANTSATFHFPFYPGDWTDDLFVELELRPKNNASMAVRFYKPDGNGGRVWSDPLTADLNPGYYGYRWKLPRDYLSDDGMQIMRASFPGSFFEGAARVSARFSRVRIGYAQDDKPKYPLALRNDDPIESPARILSQSADAFHLRAGQKLERFFIVPNDSFLSFYAGPGAWLEAPGALHITVQTDDNTSPLADISLLPGDCFRHHQIDLSPYAHQSIRLTMAYVPPEDADDGFTTAQNRHAQIYLTPPQIRIHSTALDQAKNDFSQAKRIVVLAIDNLRADRLTVPDKRRASQHLSQLFDDGVSGVVMGESKSFVAMETSFLTGVSADVHGIVEPVERVKFPSTSFAEAASAQNWRTAFYSTSAIIDSSRGFAKGFDSIHQLNKDNITSTNDALAQVLQDVIRSEENSLYYVHLSELRLPYRAPQDKIDAWGLPGYAGAVNPESMKNLIIAADPTFEDSRQLEAWYDGELAQIDDAVGAFVSQLPPQTLVLFFGTHGNSLGETALGYEQTLTPWELLMPYAFYMTGTKQAVQRDGIVRASELSASLLALLGADYPVQVKTIFEPHDSRPTANADGLTATSSWTDFYRIKREGVDAAFTTGLDGTMATRLDDLRTIDRQALREKIE